MLDTLASLSASTLARSLLYGLEPDDPATLVLAAVALTAVGVLAGWLPARMAARIDPATVARGLTVRLKADTTGITVRLMADDYTVGPAPPHLTALRTPHPTAPDAPPAPDRTPRTPRTSLHPRTRPPRRHRVQWEALLRYVGRAVAEWIDEEYLMGLGRRISLAFRAFFALLRHGTLPAEVVAAATAEPPAAAEAAPPAPATAAPIERPEDGAVLMLAVLQRESRVVDFLMEDLGAYSDAQIGAAVRDVHANCRRALVTALDLEPILDGAEDQAVSVPAGFDPASIKLVGRVVGTGPFTGMLRHRGWRSSRVQLPALGAAGSRQIIAPAEVEIS